MYTKNVNGEKNIDIKLKIHFFQLHTVLGNTFDTFYYKFDLFIH